ncbi:hypothetical protein CUTA107171_14310 [Cupriavidus taiwanensis]
MPARRGHDHGHDVVQRRRGGLHRRADPGRHRHGLCADRGAGAGAGRARDAARRAAAGDAAAQRLRGLARAPRHRHARRRLDQRRTRGRHLRRPVGAGGDAHGVAQRAGRRQHHRRGGGVVAGAGVHARAADLCLHRPDHRRDRDRHWRGRPAAGAGLPARAGGDAARHRGIVLPGRRGDLAGGAGAERQARHGAGVLCRGAAAGAGRGDGCQPSGASAD